MKKQNRIAFFNILSTILLRGISIFSSPVFSRLLGTSGYGVLSVYNTWVSVFAITGTLETGGTLVNARVEFPEEEQKKYQSSVMTLSLSFFLLCTALVLLFLNPISTYLKLSKVLIGILLFHAFGSFCANFLNSKFTYEFKADRNMFVSVGLALSTLALGLVLVLSLPQEERYMGRILGNALVYGSLGVFVCAMILRGGKTYYHKGYWKFCILLAIPAMMHNLSDLILGHSDLVMLRQMMGDDAGGIYALAFNFGNIMFTFFAALDNSWKPFFFDDLKNGKRDAVRSSARNFLELYTVLSVGFVLLVREVYHIYAGRSFWDGTMLIPVFVASYYLNFLCTFPVNFEIYHKKTMVVAVVTWVTAILNVVLNAVMISRMGMLGAAVATMLSHMLQFAFHFTYARFLMKKGEYPFGTFLWVPYVLFFFGAVAIFYLLPNQPLVRWDLGALIGLWELRQIVVVRKGLF